MIYDEDKVDDAALALLWLTLHDGNRAWKGMDFDVSDRLHQKGYIYDPANRNRSVELTPEGLERSRMPFERTFAKTEQVAGSQAAGGR